MRRVLVVLVIMLSAIQGGAALAQVPQPDYDVLRHSGDVELRRYGALLVADVTRQGTRTSAANAGFRALAGYIFGGNRPKQKIEMTAPVLQRKGGEKIDMTAPVLQQGEGGTWTISFIMPPQWTKDALPAPDESDIGFRTIPARTVAVIRFAGIPAQSLLHRKEQALRSWMAAQHLTPAGPATYAFYNPPWTLPFWRRNEVMIPVS